MKSSITSPKTVVPRHLETSDKILRRDRWLTTTKLTAKRKRLMIDAEPVLIAAATVCAQDQDLPSVASLLKKAILRYLRHEGYLTKEEP